MASTLDPFVRVVTNMMRRFGGPSTLIYKGESGEYDPSQSGPQTTDVEFPVRTITFDYIQKVEGVGTKTGSMIQDGDKQVYMQPSASVPRPRPEIDKIVYKNTTYSIVSVKEMDVTGSTVILYELCIRQ
jgi:hypothetical protein